MERENKSWEYCCQATYWLEYWDGMNYHHSSKMKSIFRQSNETTNGSSWKEWRKYPEQIYIGVWRPTDK